MVGALVHCVAFLILSPCPYTWNERRCPCGRVWTKDMDKVIREGKNL